MTPSRFCAYPEPMKTLKSLPLLAIGLLFLAVSAYACDSQGSAEDCPEDQPLNLPTHCDPGGCDVVCNMLGCSSTWITQLPMPESAVPPVIDVPPPVPDFPDPAGDATPSNLKGATIWTQFQAPIKTVP